MASWCMLAVFFRVVEDAPVVAAANREEAYARGGEPPRILSGPLRAVAGVDPTAGGTWFGVNERGVLVGLTNRPKSDPPPRPPSRGLLARDLLNCTSAREAADRAKDELNGNRYAGCNVLCADAESAVAIHAGDWLRVRPLPAGLHVLTAHDVNDTSDRRLSFALEWLGRRHFETSGQCMEGLKELCAMPGNGGPAICLRASLGGTVSSSIVALRPSLNQSAYWHAQGPPDRTPYADYSHLLRDLAVLAVSDASKKRLEVGPQDASSKRR
jgi:hypothetical protein